MAYENSYLALGGLLTGIAVLLLWLNARQGPPAFVYDPRRPRDVRAIPMIGLGDAIPLDREVQRILASQDLASLYRGTDVRLALQPGIAARADGMVLRETLSEVLATSIRSAIGGKVLLSGRRLGHWTEIEISDDGAVLDETQRIAQLQHVRDRAALNGWLFVVNAHAGLGTTVSLRVPGVPNRVIEVDEVTSQDDVLVGEAE